MKKYIDERIGIVFISLVLILSLFALMLLNGSVAWFAENMDADTSGMRVTVKNDIGVTATLKSYPVKEKNGSAYTIPSRDNESYEIPIHDPSSISYSEYKKALVIIITVDALVDSTVSIILHRDEISGVETITSPGLSNYISNCIRITPATIAEGGLVATKGADLLKPTFVDLSSNPITKSEDIVLLEHKPAYKDGVNEFCFIIEYDLDLLGYIEEKIIAQNLTDNEISYSHDIEFQIFE